MKIVVVVMNFKLTKKDKVLLYVLVIFLICFGFIWLVIFPQIDRSGDLDLSISDLQAKKMPMEAAVMGLDQMKSTYEQAVEKYDISLENFYPYMENYEIDKMITGLVTDQYNLTIASFTMSPVPTGVMVNKYHAAASGEEESSDSSQAVDGDSIPLLTSNVSVTASGQRKNIDELIDSLFKEYPAIRITGYTISGYGDTQTINLNCDVYMKTAV